MSNADMVGGGASRGRDAGAVSVPEDPAVLAQRQRIESRLFGASLPAVRVGRFTLLGVLGEGGMGVVHLAHDDVLDRKVAIKLIPRHRALSEEPADLLREAQAMARVSHANVVQVYDAGDYSRGVFVAMERVEGETLRARLSSDDGDVARASWRTRLALVVGAGRGLAEAHRVGVVHRDFKPDNVLMTARGEPKVSDFGLAGLVAAAAELEVTSVDLEQLGCTVGIVGTPLYLAPEIFEGRPADARSDQYSFCVTAYEAVYGERPFDGDTFEALRFAVTTGARRALPGKPVDKRVHAAIMRGLSIDPADRWLAMEPLLDALSAGMRKRKRRGLMLGVAALGLAAIGVVWGANDTTVCDDMERHLAGTWDAERRAALEQTFVSSETSFARETWSRVAPRLDDYGARWVAERTRVCQAMRIEHAQSEDIFALRTECLDRARTRLHASVDALAEDDAAAITHALEIVSGLPRPEECADVPGLRARRPAAAVAEPQRVEEIVEVLAQAQVQRAAGDYTAALDLARKAQGLFAEFEYPWLEAEVWLELGHTQRDRLADDEARVAFARAQTLAIQTSQWELALDAASGLAFVLGARLFRFGQANTQMEVARGLLARGVSAEHQAAFHMNQAGVHYHQAQYEESIESYRAALVAWEELGSVAGPRQADARANLGQALRAGGHYEEAEAELRASLAQQIELRGAAHPKVVRAMQEIGILQTQLGQYDEALATLDEAETMAERIMPDHPQTALVTVAKGGVFTAQAKFDEAISLLEAALLRWEPTLGAGHRTTISMHGNIGAALANDGRVALGEPHLAAVVEGSTALFGADHPDTADARSNYGTVLQMLGRFSEAEEQHRGALEVLRTQLGAGHRRTARVHTALAGTIADQGRHGEAIIEYRAILAALAANVSPEHPSIATLHNDLATVLQSEGQHAEAEAELRQALTVFEQILPESHPTLVIVLTNIGRAVQAQGDLDGALVPLERAVKISATLPGSPRARGDARRALATVLRHNDGDAARIAELIELARADYHALPPHTSDAQLEELNALAN